MGLQMLAAVLENAGHEVLLLDANADGRRRSTEQIVEQAAVLRPHIIGITLVTPLVKEAYRLAAGLRGCGAKLIAGGPHATLLPEEPLDHGFDAVVVGEGEPTIAEAVRAVLGAMPLESVRGLVYRGPDGLARHNALRPLVADLDALPLPARHLVDPACYGVLTPQSLHTNIFTSRGCPARCAYCAGGLFGKQFRFRSADSVVDEVVAVHRQYGTRHFHFVDDAMTMDRERVKRICARLLDERLGLTWSMMTRIDAVDEELLELAARAGCIQIDYGVESGSADTLKRIHKPHTVEMVRRVISLMQRHGIRPNVFFILGFPWEDCKAIDETQQLMRDIAPCVMFHPAIASVLIPFPGTEIYRRYKDEHHFDGWWLSDDRTFDAPQADVHPFYQWVIYRVGAVLDADFFRYSPQVRAKIHDVFRFMHASNLRHSNVVVRTAMLLAIDLSRQLHAVSPALERAVFKAPIKLWPLLRGTRESLRRAYRRLRGGSARAAAGA
jgi:anaerobic magnesium-protoporphyrin IX monomethyl ester cyclase